MEKGLLYLNGIVAAILTPIAVMLGGWDMLLQVLVSFIVIDYLTGVIVAVSQKRLSSDVGFKGLLKKATILAVVFLAVQLDKVTGTDIIRTMAILFYCSNEGFSILENTSKLGVPYPQAIKDILIQVRNRSAASAKGSGSDGQ